MIDLLIRRNHIFFLIWIFGDKRSSSLHHWCNSIKSTSSSTLCCLKAGRVLRVVFFIEDFNRLEVKKATFTMCCILDGKELTKFWFTFLKIYQLAKKEKKDDKQQTLSVIFPYKQTQSQGPVLHEVYIVNRTSCFIANSFVPILKLNSSQFFLILKEMKVIFGIVNFLQKYSILLKCILIYTHKTLVSSVGGA